MDWRYRIHPLIHDCWEARNVVFLRAICEDAGITTGALYKRFTGKEDLFAAVVQETIDAIDSVITRRSSVPVTELSDADLIRAWNMDQEDMMWWMRFLHEHHDGFTLLLRCSGSCGKND